MAPPIIDTTPTKEDRLVARAKKDATVPLIHAKHIHWVPSAYALRAQHNMVLELEWRLKRANSPRLRNAIRSELRMAKSILARKHVPNGKKPWSTEIFHARQSSISVFISPKKLRYVLADADAPADLIVANRKNRKSLPFSRLQRFEKSRYAKMVKAERQEDAVHKKRAKVKAAHRAKRREQQRAVVSE